MMMTTNDTVDGRKTAMTAHGWWCLKKHDVANGRKKSRRIINKEATTTIIRRFVLHQHATLRFGRYNDLL